MNRRGFVSTLACWLGFGVAIKAANQEEIIDCGQGMPLTEEESVLYALARKVHPKVYGLKRPNDKDTTEEYLAKVVKQLETTGSAIIWKCPDIFGRIQDVYVLPTQCVFPMTKYGWYQYCKIVEPSGWVAHFKIEENAIDRIQSPFPLAR